MKILIVDDDEIARLSLSNILRHSAAEIVEAQDGEEAWALLEGGLHPALCCSDIVMPNLDGLDLLKRARQHPVLRDLPFVLITSAADRQTVETAIAGGITGYILKPFLTVQTRTTVERALRETLATQAEAPQLTRRRLGVDDTRLERMLQLFKAEVLACAAELAAPGEASMARTQRLHGGALVLGLWGCASVLERAGEATCSDAHRIFALEEVARRVDDQLAHVSPGSKAMPEAVAEVPADADAEAAADGGAESEGQDEEAAA